jgi:hypothetical protein
VIFRYLGRPDATKEAWTEDGWFRTGDVAVRSPYPVTEPGYIYKILGRASVDIIKVRECFRSIVYFIHLDIVPSMNLFSRPADIKSQHWKLSENCWRVRGSRMLP